MTVVSSQQRQPSSEGPPPSSPPPVPTALIPAFLRYSPTKVKTVHRAVWRRRWIVSFSSPPPVFFGFLVELEHPLLSDRCPFPQIAFCQSTFVEGNNTSPRCPAAFEAFDSDLFQESFFFFPDKFSTLDDFSVRCFEIGPVFSQLFILLVLPDPKLIGFPFWPLPEISFSLYRYCRFRRPAEIRRSRSPSHNPPTIWGFLFFRVSFPHLRFLIPDHPLCCCVSHGPQDNALWHWRTDQFLPFA